MAATIYTNCSVLTLGCFLFQDSGLTTPVSNGEYSDGTDVFTVTGGAGEITASAICNPPTSTTTSTTTAASTTSTTTSTTTLQAFVPTYFDTTQVGACSSTTLVNAYIVPFSAVPPVVGSILYTDASLTTGLPNGYYWYDASTVYQVDDAVTAGQVIAITACAPPTANIDITNGSLDIVISNVNFNGVDATFVSGVYPNTTGNGTALYTDQVGTYTLLVFRSNSVAGQHITVTDSNGTSQCIAFSNGSQNEVFTGVVYDGITNILIDAQDGAC